MKYVFVFLTILLVLSVSTAFAGVTAADIYPQGATLTEDITAVVAPNSDRRTILLYVPAQIQESSLNVTVPGVTVLSLSTRQLMNFEPDPRREKLKEKLEEAQNTLATIEDEINTLEARKAYWAYPYKDTADVAKMQQIDAAIQSKMTELLAQVRRLNQAKAKQKDTIATLKEAYEKAGPTMVVMAALERPVSENTVQAQCSYYTSQAFWQARYRFDARPQKSDVSMSLSAEIVQNTGFSWENADINLITLNPSGTIVPPSVRPWVVRVIKPMPVAQPRAAINAEASMMADSPVLLKSAGASPAYMEPTQESRGVYAVWNIGKKSLGTGTPISVPLMETELKGEFYDIVRPRLAGTAFLMARVSFPSDQQLTSGQAAFFIDGALAGESYFDPLNTVEPDKGQSGAAATPKTDDNKTRYDLFFGPDRLVTCRYIELARTNDQSGLLKKVQSRIWRWRVEVMNRRAVPVTVRVEDAAPQLQDERIKLELKALPAPERTENNLYVWKAKLNSKDLFTINCEVNISAPEDLNLSSTR